MKLIIVTELWDFNSWRSSPCVLSTFLMVSLPLIWNAGVSMASLTELSFNWVGFISAMISNISFTYRSIYSKKAMVIFYATLFNPFTLNLMKLDSSQLLFKVFPSNDLFIFICLILVCRLTWIVLISMLTFPSLLCLSVFHLPSL